MNSKLRQVLILILLILLLFVPAIHKLWDDIPPAWFIGKFENSLIRAFPEGLTLSYTLIIILEIVGPLLLLSSLIQQLRQKESKQLRVIGFMIYYLLFIILTFGSFLVQDYDNGFKDFMYFVGIAVLEKYFFSETE